MSIILIFTIYIIYVFYDFEFTCPIIILNVRLLQYKLILGYIIVFYSGFFFIFMSFVINGFKNLKKKNKQTNIPR
jgi:hypothetical protein